MQAYVTSLCENHKRPFKSGRKHRVRSGLPTLCKSIALVALVGIFLGISIFNVDYLFSSSDGEVSQTSRRLIGESMCHAPTDDDNITCPDKLNPKALVIPYLMGVFYIFWAIAVVCDDFFVPALEVISDRLNMGDDIAGATLMAAGGSAPELATSLIGTFTGSDVGFGTIVGSAVFNVLFVIACCVAFTPDKFAPLELTSWPLARDCSYYILSLVTLYLFFGVITPEQIDLFEAIVLFVLYIGYCIIMYYNEELQLRIMGKKVEPEEEEEKAVQEDIKSAQRNTFYQPSRFRTGFFSISNNNGLSLFDNAGLGVVYKLKGNVRECFEALDTDKSGTLEKPEIKILLKNLFEPANGIIKDEQVDEIMTELDLDNNGVIDLHEFTEWYLKSATRLRHEERSVFDELDTKGVGSIPISKLPHMLLRLEVVVDDDYVADVMKHFEDKAIESNTPGMFTFDDFSKWFEGSPFWETKQKVADAVAEDHEGILNELMAFPKDNFKTNCLYILMAPILWGLALTMGFTDVRIPGNERWCYYQFLISIVWIGLYSYFMVDWITAVGTTLGIPDVVMGLTLLAAGTSVPDLLSSVVVAKAGKGDMAVSSSIGSNIFDVTVGLPVPWILFNIIIGCPVQVGADNLVISIVILTGMVFTVVMTIMLSGWKMSKSLGITMMVCYVLFMGQDVMRVFMSNKKIC